MKRTKMSLFGKRTGSKLILASLPALFGAGCSSDDDAAAAPTQSSALGAAGSGSSAKPCPTVAAPAAPAPVAAAPALPPGSLRVCDRPESAYFDALSDAWYVSCQAKNDVPDDGYIAKLNAGGTAIVTEKFVSGLDEPKGIRVHAGKLYVSDVSELVTADVATGAKLNTTSVVGIDPRVPTASWSLNDVNVYEPTGDVYVSDNRNDQLYRFDASGGSPQLLVSGPVLEGPNGLLFDTRDPAAPRLLIASLGPGLNPMRGVTAKLGAVLSFALADVNDGNAELSASFVTPRIGNLDGIEWLGNDLLVTDFFSGRLMQVTPSSAAPAFNTGDAEILQQGFDTSADLGLDVGRGRIAVPETAAGTVVFIDVAAL
jgi:hypothetical protein